jgi:acyl carrier protein
MTKQEIADKLKEFFHQEFPNPGKELTDTTNLLTDWLVDSFGVVSTAMFLEREFGVNVEPADINAEVFESIATLTDYVAARTGTATE